MTTNIEANETEANGAANIEVNGAANISANRNEQMESSKNSEQSESENLSDSSDLNKASNVATDRRLNVDCGTPEEFKNSPELQTAAEVRRRSGIVKSQVKIIDEMPEFHTRDRKISKIGKSNTLSNQDRNVISDDDDEKMF